MTTTTELQHIVDEMTTINTVIRATADELADLVATLDDSEPNKTRIVELVGALGDTSRVGRTFAVVPTDDHPPTVTVTTPIADIAAANTQAAAEAAAVVQQQADAQHTAAATGAADGQVTPGAASSTPDGSTEPPA